MPYVFLKFVNVSLSPFGKALLGFLNMEAWIHWVRGRERDLLGATACPWPLSRGLTALVSTTSKTVAEAEEQVETVPQPNLRTPTHISYTFLFLLHGAQTLVVGLLPFEVTSTKHDVWGLQVCVKAWLKDCMCHLVDQPNPVACCSFCGIFLMTSLLWAPGQGHHWVKVILCATKKEKVTH